MPTIPTMPTVSKAPVPAQTVPSYDPRPASLPPRRRNLQDTLLSRLCRTRMAATVFLMNGFQLRGEIRGFDAFVVIIYSDGRQQMVYKHAISTVVPERPITLE